MKKLIIQIPAFNEEETLPATVRDLPRSLRGYDAVEWLVIDDGSTDRTAEVARSLGVDHVVVLTHNHGLARAFIAGIRRCLELGADTIVNTDADNQYRADCIPALVQPILENKADIVIGQRPISSIENFSRVKKWLQTIGSRVVSIASGTAIPDAPSGFRAFRRKAAIALVVHNRFSYTLETIIQAGRSNFRMISVPIEVNSKTRPSRLFKSNLDYVIRSLLIILRVFVTYRPLRFFCCLALLCFVPGLLIGLRFLVFFLLGEGGGKVQSLILSAILLMASVVFLVAGILADLIATNRMLLEEVRISIFTRDLADTGALDKADACPKEASIRRQSTGITDLNYREHTSS